MAKKKPKWWDEHQEFLKKFTDCEEVNVSSSNKKKVQRKTNKSNESSTAHVQAALYWIYQE